MITDSLQRFEAPSREFADSLYKAVQVVGDHTDEFGGWALGVTIISLLASIATIAGILVLAIEWWKRKVNKGCQRRILLDIIRHMFTNNSISEGIRLKYPPSGRCVLKEGLLERFCFLDSDIELSNMNFTEKSYDRLHSLRLRLKNYNSVAMLAEKHFTDPDCPREERLEDLDDIWKRSIRLTVGFMKYADMVGLNITSKDISDYYKRLHPHLL